MRKGNLYLSDEEVRLVLGAVDSILEALPVGDEVPEVDRADAERDRGAYQALRLKIEKHGGTT